MKIGIVCAGDREVAPFIPMIDDCNVFEKAMLKFYTGKINGVDIVTLYSGVCKVNAAIATQIMIDTFECDAIINSGTAGGIAPELDIFDTVISTEVAYHDLDEGILTDFHPWLESVYFKADEKLLYVSKNYRDKKYHANRIYLGKMVTGEKFIEHHNRNEIIEKFSPLSVDMESASIAHVCYVNKIPFLAVRTITDTASQSGTGAFEENCDKASMISAEIVYDILKEINNTFSIMGKKVHVTIDRPMGSFHPEHPEIYYPVNYGYIKDIQGGDGEEQDVYVLGINEAIDEFTGEVAAIVHRNDDYEDKWVVVPYGMRLSRQEIQEKIDFQEKYFDSIVIM